MKPTMTRAAIGAALFALSLTTTAVAQQHGQMDHGAMQHGMMNMPKTPYSDAEMKMSHEMMMATGKDASHTWAKKMIEHHEGAIAMSRIVLQNSKDAEIRRMAQKTIEENTKGVAGLRAWLSKHP